MSTESGQAHLRRFFQLDVEDTDGKTMPFANPAGMPEDLRERRCAELYETMTKVAAVDMHRNALAAAKAFGTWCVEKEWIRENPAEGVKPIGQRNRGKKQLRIDEARRLVEVCLQKANLGSEGAIAALTAFLMGMRASEVTDRVVRDLDDNGKLLWIEVGKTKRSRRTLEVPALLRPYLLALAKDRAPDEQLITRGKSTHGNKHGQHWLLRHMRLLCAEAGVPVVGAHSLRGLHATLATEAGVSSHAVAAALGHSSPAGDARALHRGRDGAARPHQEGDRQARSRHRIAHPG